MAGAYPDVPGYRFAYDKDGTSVLVYDQSGGAIKTVTSTDVASINCNQMNRGSGSFSTGYYSGVTPNYLVFVFPEKRNILGYFVSIWNGAANLDVSTDTTNGQDGTWTTKLNPYVYINYGSYPLSPKYRSDIQSVNWTNIKAVRFAMNDWLVAIHLYGSIATTESPDRLRIVDMSSNDIAAQLDFGDIPQRNNSTKQFKVVNNSSTMTANNITITMDTNPDASPTLIGQYQLSTDNTAFANAINIGTLAPGASSGTLYVRDTIANTAQLGPWSVRLIASANTWS